LVEVEPVEIERHSRNTKSGKPNTHDWPSSKEEMQLTRIVKRSILENETTEVSMSS
jgi:hypothetical protein